MSGMGQAEKIKGGSGKFGFKSSINKQSGYELLFTF
jgi:hypothetical protein